MKIHFIPSILLKTASGIGVGLIYYYHYSAGDTIMYNDTARFITSHLQLDMGGWISFLIHSDLPDYGNELPYIFNESRSLFFIKILSLLYLFTGTSYWVSGLFLSLFSFYGAWYLTNTITKYYPHLKFQALAAFLYLPGVVFWTSGVLKESVAYPCIMLLVSCFLILMKEKRSDFYTIILMLPLFFILWMIKYHYAAILFVILFSAFIYQWISKSYFRRESIWIYLGIIIVPAFLMTLVHPNFNLSVIIEVITQNHNSIINLSDPGNHIHFINVDGDLTRFLINIPVSLAGGLFMPLPWQGNNWLIHLAGVINLIILILFLAKFIHAFRKGIKTNVIFYSFVFYISFSAILLAYTSPNFGTLERYKISYIPFFVFWICINNPIIDRIKKKTQ